jgi:DNA-directed RNA polymerase specialized sigma24 family protein
MGDRTKRPMSETERDLIITLRIQGKTYPELAKLTERPLGTISSVISKAILTRKDLRTREMDPLVKRKTL